MPDSEGVSAAKQSSRSDFTNELQNWNLIVPDIRLISPDRITYYGLKVTRKPWLCCLTLVSIVMNLSTPQVYYKLCTKSICTHINCQIYQKLKYYVKMECIREKCSFLLCILTLLPLLCDVVWPSYGYSNGLRSHFKSCKIPYSIQIKGDTHSFNQPLNITWSIYATRSSEMSHAIQSSEYVRHYQIWVLLLIW